jgi:hypothetical protein
MALQQLAASGQRQALPAPVNLNALPALCGTLPARGLLLLLLGHLLPDLGHHAAITWTVITVITVLV